MERETKQHRKQNKMSEKQDGDEHSQSLQKEIGVCERKKKIRPE